MSEAASSSRATWVIPVVIYIVAAAVYALLGSMQELPLISPDEFLYGRLARSLADGQGLSINGADQQWPMALYIYLLAPSWVLASGEAAYDLAKITGALVACTVVFPVWALSRLLTPGRPAVVPVVLTVAGTWMITAAGLVNENLAFPLATAALVSAVLALRDPDSRRWTWLALGFAVAATASRAQLAVLFPIFLTALVLDAAFAEDPRARLQRHRVPIGVLGVIVIAGLIALLGGSASVLGPYTDVSDFSPPLGRVADRVVEQWIALAIMCAVLPLAALIAVGAERSAWRDRDLGPLLCVTVPTVVLLLLESGYFNAGLGDALSWSIERYVVYAVPLLLVLLITALHRRALNPVWFGLAGLGVALTMLATRDITAAVEQRAQFATWTRVDDLIDGEPWLALTLVSLLVVGVGTLLLARFKGMTVIYSVGALLVIVLALQSQAVWNWQLDFARATRAQYPKDLSWVNANAGGPVTRLYLFQNSPLSPAAELFNDDVEQVLTPSVAVPGRVPLGATCPWTADPRGVVQVDPSCGVVRSRIWNDDPFVSMSFHGGKILARDHFMGQVIAVPPKPRLRSLVRSPCQRATIAGGRDGSPTGIPSNTPCTPHMSVILWVDSPGELEMTFEGGTRVHHIRQGGRSWTLPPNERTTIKVPVNAAATNLAFALDWNRSACTPRLVDAAFVTGSDRQPLI